MNSPFFIVGLPQSRTSWLANLFSTGGVFCHHDLLGQVESVDAFCSVMRRDAMEGRVGDADSGLVSAYAKVMAAFPGAPWVLVVRDFEDAWESLCTFVAGGPWSRQIECNWELHERMAQEWAAARKAILQLNRCMEVYYESLDNPDTIERIWKHCVPGVRFDARRAKMLQTMSVRPFQAKTAMKPAAKLVGELYPAT